MTPAMKFSSPVNSHHYPNLPALERIVREWNPPHVEGEVLLLPSSEVPEAVCLLFKGTVRGKEVPHSGWCASQIIFKHPDLIKAMERVLMEFLESILGAESSLDGSNWRESSE
jgi:hypothetical protein